MRSAVAICIFSTLSHAANPTRNILEFAAATPDLSTLVSALKAGKETDLLSSIPSPPLTLFAPTNEAFAKVPSGMLEHLLDPANTKELQSVLEYHVISGAILYSKELKTYQTVKTVEGNDVKIVKGGRVIVNNATVTSADNSATNGVVHLIDTVLFPPTTPSPAPTPVVTKGIVQLAKSLPDLSTLVTALGAGNLTTMLSGTGPFTVFAPSNEAFAKLPAYTLARLLDPANSKELQSVLEYHVISGAAVFAKDLNSRQTVKTAEGETLDVRRNVQTGEVTITDAAKHTGLVTTADVAASNGVVHIIDAVLSPALAAGKRLLRGGGGGGRARTALAR